MVNFWWNSIEGLKHPFATENFQNTKFLVGAAILAAIMDQANRYFNDGKGMLENPRGTEDKLLIPISKITGNPNDTTVIGIPFLSSIATMPRLILRSGKAIYEGDIKGASKDILQTLSSVFIRPLADIMANENYFGDEIVKSGTIGAEKWAQIGMYLASQYISHPYLKEIFTPTNADDPLYQRLSRASELPFRFYTQDTIAAKYYYEAQSDAVKGLKIDEKAAYDAIPDYNPNDPLAEMFKYQVYLKYPAVFLAKQQTAIKTAKDNNQVIDPLYLAPYTVVKDYILYQTLPPGSPDAKALKKSKPEVVGLMAARSQYFSTLDNLTFNSSAPQASPYVQQQMNAKNWSDPQVQSYLDTYSQYTDQQRAKLGLPPTEKYTPYKRKTYFRKVSAPKLKAFKLKKVKMKKIKIKKAKVYKLKKTGTIKLIKLKKVKFA
jgi:hypothetical protein